MTTKISTRHRTVSLTPKQKAYQRWYKKNRKHKRKQAALWAKRHPESVNRYARNYYQKNREKIREYRRKWAKDNYARVMAYPCRSPERRRALGLRYWQKLRSDVFALYGQQCAQCGFEDFRALQLDHINNDGCVVRQQYGAYKSGITLRDARKSYQPKKYQILCANCNTIKKFEHEKKRCMEREKKRSCSKNRSRVEPAR